MIKLAIYFLGVATWPAFVIAWFYAPYVANWLVP